MRRLIASSAPTLMRNNCGALKDQWYAAALSKELGSRKPLGRVILEQALVLWRTGAGTAVCMEDRCAHRNAKLSEGDLFDDKIGCTYHGWTYDETGRCVQVPSEGPKEPKVPCGVESFAVREQDGIIWVWMGDKNAITREPFSMPYWDTKGWGAYYMITPFENDVTHLVENFMDVPHTTFVHHGWFRTKKHVPVRATVERTEDSVLVNYELAKDSIGFSDYVLNPRGQRMTHTDKFYMPNNTRVDYQYGEDGNAFVITSTCTPRGPFDTMVYTLISYKLGLLNRLVKLPLHWYTRRVIEQDVVIMRNQGSNLKRHGGVCKFNSTEADRLHEYIESLREHAESGGGKEAPEPRKDEIDFWI